MSRQIRLDDDVVELVEARNPAELSLSGRTNELLRAFLTRVPDSGQPATEFRGTDNAERVARSTTEPGGIDRPPRMPERRPRRRRGSDAPLSDAEARALRDRFR